jgi:hypothetical protein
MPRFPNPGFQGPPQFPGAPSFDPNNAMEAMMNFQNMGLPMPMPDFSQQLQQNRPGQQGKRRQRCRDYDTKGYCARGNTCMFEHGNDSIFVPPAIPMPQGQGGEGKP